MAKAVSTYSKLKAKPVSASVWHPHHGTEQVEFDSQLELAWWNTFTMLHQASGGQGWIWKGEREIREWISEQNIGGYWIPDFSLEANTGGAIWVEIKPHTLHFDGGRTAREKVEEKEAKRTRMEAFPSVKGQDFLMYLWGKPNLSRIPVPFGWIGEYSALSVDEKGRPAEGWHWWNAFAWFYPDLSRWGLVVPAIRRELIIEDVDVPFSAAGS